MKILLLAFNVQEDIFPLGLRYLQAFANQHHPDVDVQIKEFSFGNRTAYATNKNIELQALSYIFLEKPDVVAFSCYIWSAQMIKDFARSIKSMNPAIKVLLGGVEVQESLLESSIDFIIQGEGEIAFKELVDFFKGLREKQDIHNIMYLANGVLKKGPTAFIENLDTIPIPFNNDEHIKYTVMRLETARGCAFDCSFCHYAIPPLRHFSLPYMEKSIAELFRSYEFSYLTILDGTFNSDINRMFAILDMVECEAKRKIKHIIIHCEMRPEMLDKEIVEKLQKYSFKMNIEFGLQSTHPEVLKAVKRYTNLSKVRENLALLDNSSINYKIDLMYGLPQDTFFRFLLSARFILDNAKKQHNLVAHHFMLLNNTDSLQHENVDRYTDATSGMVIRTETQDAFDIYKTKLFLDLINDELDVCKHIQRKN